MQSMTKYNHEFDCPRLNIEGAVSYCATEGTILLNIGLQDKDIETKGYFMAFKLDERVIKEVLNEQCSSNR